jgi:hypothetical protein
MYYRDVHADESCSDELQQMMKMSDTEGSFQMPPLNIQVFFDKTRKTVFNAMEIKKNLQLNLAVNYVLTNKYFSQRRLWRNISGQLPQCH